MLWIEKILGVFVKTYSGPRNSDHQFSKIVV